jgi:hypothetical protein
MVGKNGRPPKNKAIWPLDRAFESNDNQAKKRKWQVPNPLAKDN